MKNKYTVHFLEAVNIDFKNIYCLFFWVQDSTNDIEGFLEVEAVGSRHRGLVPENYVKVVKIK